MPTHLPTRMTTGIAAPWWTFLLALGLAGMGTAAQAQSNADEDAALGLEIATPAAEAKEKPRAWSLTSEVGAIAIHERNGWANEAATRAAVALRGNYQASETTNVRYAAR